MSRNQLFTERLEICVTPEQKKKLEKIAKKNGVRINQLVRNIIDWYEGRLNG